MPTPSQALRVIIWGINYAPEPTGISNYTTDLAEFLQRRGMGVEVVTGFPYYPAWAVAPGDRGRWYRSDRIASVLVHRCWLYVPRRLSALRRILHEASFLISSTVRVLWLKRADLYVVISPPLGLGLAAWFVTRLKRRRYLFHVQDLQPDSAAGLGMVRAGLFLRLMYASERFAYRHAAGVSGISPGMAQAFAAKGVAASRIFLLPNWLRGSPSRSRETHDTAGDFRRHCGIPADALLAVYSGNLGRKQGLMVLLDAAELLAADPPQGRAVRIVIAGDGAEKARLAERLRGRPLPNIQLRPLLPDGEYRAMLREADVALITQEPGTGQVCFPSKLLSVLAAGLPVITAADAASDLATAIRAGGFGVNVPATDGAALARVLREVAENPARLVEWAARTRWVEQFSADVLLPKFEDALRDLAGVPLAAEATSPAVAA